MRWVTTALAISRPRSARYDELAASSLCWRSPAPCYPEAPSSAEELDRRPEQRNWRCRANAGAHLRVAEVAALRAAALALADRLGEISRQDVHAALPALRPSQVHHLLYGLCRDRLLESRRQYNGKSMIALYRRPQPLVATAASHHKP